MSQRVHISALFAPTLLLVVATGACTDAALPVSPEETVVAQTATRSADADVNRDFATLRRVTAHFHRFENAAPAGWDLQVTGCVENPPEGGMGYHYGNLGIYLDGVANVEEPEILLYEPQPGGTLRLVAVEYAVPFFAWEGTGAPRLFGRDMKRVDAQGEWQLHVWIWKHNPSGIFEDWNPKVNCAFAS